MGSHTWNGIGIDPNYHGSSFIANHYGWVPIKEEILEVVSEDRKFIAEREWIEKYADLYGIADCALTLCKFKNNPFIINHRNKGRLLNLHANGSELAREALKQSPNKNNRFSKEAREAWRKSIRGSGAWERVVAARRAAITSESARKGAETRRENGTMEEALRKATEAARSHESRERSRKTRIANARKCILQDGFVGTLPEIVEHTGLKEGSVGAKMSQAYKLGESKIKGWIFKPL